MIAIIYASRATEDLGENQLAALLDQSRVNNGHVGLTGMLLYRDGRFLQLLEGDEPAVRKRMEVIATDPRHRNVTVLLEDVIGDRQFPEWSMAFPAISSDEVDSIPGYRRAFDDLDAGTGPSAPALRELTRWFRSRGD